jgi:hypothetical protein
MNKLLTLLLAVSCTALAVPKQPVNVTVDKTTGVLIWPPASTFRTANEISGGTSGEANTASNIGVAGIGLFNGKAGTDLQFRNVMGLTDNVVITYDSSTKIVNFNVPEANLDGSLIPFNGLATIGINPGVTGGVYLAARYNGANTFAGVQTFGETVNFSGPVVLSQLASGPYFGIRQTNLGTAHTINFVAPTVSATAQALVPNLLTDDTVVFNGFAATLTNKVISGASNTITGITPAGTSLSSASVLLGRGAGAGAGVGQEITLGSGLTLTGTVLSNSYENVTAVLTNKTLDGDNNTLQDISPTSLKLSAASVLVGRGSAGGAGAGQEITLGTGLAFAGTTLSTTADNFVTTAGDVTNSTTTYADVTGLSFAVVSGETYWFQASVLYDAAATTTGSKWSINGPASPTRVAFKYSVSLTTTTTTDGNANFYDLPTASNATSAYTNANVALLEGFITPSASGTVTVRFGSEVAASAITVKAGSILRWRKTL